jgi:hypothetical protein
MENLFQEIHLDKQACSNCGSVFQSILSYRTVMNDEIKIMQAVECYECKNKWKVVGLTKSPSLWKSKKISE